MSVDVRLPNPSILTCNEPVPLRLIAKKLTETSDIIFLQMLQIELVSYTKILAHDLTRTESGSWVIMSRSNMGMPLGKPEDPAGTDWTIDSKLWNSLPLPNSVAPSFETCNIERAYELEVRVGLTHGSPGNMKVSLLSKSFTSSADSLIAPAYCSPSANASQSLLWDCSASSSLRCYGSGSLATITFQTKTTTYLARRRRRQSTPNAPSASNQRTRPRGRQRCV